jgi:hypothetical protein
VFSKERIKNMRLISVLVFLSLFTGCVARPKAIKRFAIGSEERYEIKCMEGGVEEAYEWIKIGVDDSAFNNEKRIWDFTGTRKSDGKVLRVVNTNCRMETGIWI